MSKSNPKQIQKDPKGDQKLGKTIEIELKQTKKDLKPRKQPKIS